jgi:hypothetical protein
MKNMFGEEVSDERVPFEFNWMESVCILDIQRGGKYFGQVSSNGWTGASKRTGVPLGAPLLSNVNCDLSFTDMHEIMNEWFSHITPEKSLEFVQKKIAEEHERREKRNAI